MEYVYMLYRIPIKKFVYIFHIHIPIYISYTYIENMHVGIHIHIPIYIFYTYIENMHVGIGMWNTNAMCVYVYGIYVERIYRNMYMDFV